MLSAYQLTCGSVEKWTRAQYSLELYREHNAYHVRAFSDARRLSWQVFPELAGAQKHFRAVRRNLIRDISEG